MGEQVTDPGLLAQLNAPGPAAPTQVTDPALLAELNAPDTAQSPPDTSLASIGRNFLSAAMRPVINAVGSIPEMAANAGVGLRNISERAVNNLAPQFADAIYAANRHLAGDSEMLAALLPQGRGPEGNQYQSYSSFYRPGIDATFAPPQTFPGKAAEFASMALVGGAVPAPQAAAQAPAGFVRAMTTPRDLALEAGQARGLAVPPSTTNPTVLNKLLESLGGKTGTAQDFSAANQSIINDAARIAARLAEGEQITNTALNQAASKAAQGYDAARSAGTMEIDKAYEQAVDSAVRQFRDAATSGRPSLGNSEVVKIADELKAQPIEGSAAVDYIGLLREKANEAYRAGSDKVGAAYKAMANATESLIERGLQSQGKDGAAALASFREGRKALAQIHDVADALHSASGNVQASVLKNAFENAPERMSGPLRTVGAFASNFPKATQLVQDSGSVRNTDVALGGLAAVMKHQPWFLAYPFLRLGVRQGLLASPSLAVPGATQVPPGLLMGSQAATEDLLGQQ